MLASYFIHMANYNIWANRKLYSACKALGEETIQKECPSYFGSIHKTLNHILLGDMIWMARFLGEENAPTKLDQLLHDNFADLTDARIAFDEKILDFSISLTEERLSEAFQYTDIAGSPHAMPFSICVGHMFNHQTHHRGQVHGLLIQEMEEPPALDLVYFTLEQLEGN